MEFRILFIFVEGEDDERFFRRIIQPEYEKKYASVMLWKYAKTKKEKVLNFLKSIKSMNADYIFITDINLAPCISNRKQKMQDKFTGLDEDRIVVVIKEIESWYLAGLSDDFLRQFKIPFYSETENITKEQFNNLIPRKFNSRISFMVEILDYFSIEIATQKNRSFKYFFEKYVGGI